jgi:aromatic ring-cleaving dioxygenase
MRPMVPLALTDIANYHAHIYFESGSKADALRIRQWITERFAVQLGRVHEKPVGPHSQPMFQVAFTREEFPRLVPWLMLNRLGLSILVHPNTGHERNDHLVHALWLGMPLRLAPDVLSSHRDPLAIDPIAPNTVPHIDP